MKPTAESRSKVECIGNFLGNAFKIKIHFSFIFEDLIEVILRCRDHLVQLFFLFFINLGVGAFNLLPIKGLDGGRMWELVFVRASKKHGLRILDITTWLLILVVVLNFALVFKPA